ncbi:hypothetical protein SDC9_118661 [bioreactor metagenome]|uniref:Uncharacterized protein n=1 Tax=bioreactor metagenome TaxID=1076179 RepID=A0A645C412_9ZZZZ
MEGFDHILRQFLIRHINHIIKTLEMIDCFDDVIDRSSFFLRHRYRIRFVNIARLLFRQDASFYPIGVIGKFDLGLMIQSALQLHSFLFPQKL